MSSSRSHGIQCHCGPFPLPAPPLLEGFHELLLSELLKGPARERGKNCGPPPSWDFILSLLPFPLPPLWAALWLLRAPFQMGLRMGPPWVWLVHCFFMHLFSRVEAAPGTESAPHPKTKQRRCPRDQQHDCHQRDLLLERERRASLAARYGQCLVWVGRVGHCA